MRTVEQVIGQLAEIIADIHNRPSLYIDSTSKPRAADFLESLMGILHRLWAFAQSRDKELNRAIYHGGSLLHFANETRIKTNRQHATTC
jgi:hypothetical protein